MRIFHANTSAKQLQKTLGRVDGLGRPLSEWIPKSGG